ncbi:MAG: SusE domain-containing protein [Clostridium sp.]|nr:SusE domain-containing protein [Clostridium sp.]
MKKLSIFMALVAVMLGFTACSDDTDPVYKDPTKFVLNTPALASQYYELTPDGTIVLTCTQPDYGFTASTTYGVEVALSEDGETYNIAPEVPTSAQIRIKASDLATAICVLRGIKTEDDWTEEPARAVYMRATAQLAEHPNTLITSNWVKLDAVKEYFAVPVPGYIYLVGSPEGWKGPDAANADHYADWRLFEKDDAIDSKVYYGVFDMPAAPMFRFYTALTGWDADSWGSQADDSAIDYELANGSWEGSIVKGKGSFNFPKFEGGQMTLIVDMVNNRITVVEGNAM